MVNTSSSSGAWCDSGRGDPNRCRNRSCSSAIAWERASSSDDSPVVAASARSVASRRLPTDGRGAGRVLPPFRAGAPPLTEPWSAVTEEPGAPPKAALLPQEESVPSILWRMAQAPPGVAPTQGHHSLGGPALTEPVRGVALAAGSWGPGGSGCSWESTVLEPSCRALEGCLQRPRPQCLCCLWQ